MSHCLCKFIFLSIILVVPMLTLRKEDNFQYFNKQYCDNLSKKLGDFWSNEQFCDVDLKSGDAVVKASRLVLAAASPHLGDIVKDMWRNGTLQGSVHLPCDLVAPAILKELVDYMYTGEIVITSWNVRQLISAAALLQLQPLSAACAGFLNDRLEPADSFEMSRFADAHNLTELKRNALTCATAHWNASGAQEISDLPTPLLIEIMSMDKLAAQHEPEVIRAGLQHLAKMGALDVALSIPDLSVAALLDALEAAQEEAERSWGMLEIGITQELVTIAEPTATERVRRTEPQLYIIGGCRDPENPYASTLKYGMHTKTWNKVSPMNTARLGLAAASLDGLIYAVGGFNKTALAVAEVYDPVTDKWSPIAAMSEPRYMFALVELEGKLYSFGGTNGGYVLSSIEVYDPVVNGWSNVGHMPQPRCGMGAVTYGGAVYVVGGALDAEAKRQSADLLRYDPPLGQWRQLSPMHHHRFEAGVALSGTSLYALGGLEGFSVLSEVERYDFQSDKWEEVEEMLTPRQAPVVGAAEGKLVVVGGHFKILYIMMYPPLVDEYDVPTGRWAVASQLPRKRTEAASVVLFTY